MAECRVCGRKVKNMVREIDGKYRCRDKGCNDKEGTFIPMKRNELTNFYVPPSQQDFYDLDS